ncbi:helix-turn-helix domain-containing protein [Priestia aryabhattai]|uniref:helix-turn-helix domain-containing protein n=1 Tax=Priestia aryabhattai TaxID=412384 RepID=UPI003CBF59D8
MNKVPQSKITQYKELMKEDLGEHYIHPQDVNNPLFIIQNVASYDEYSGDIIYTPYVSVNTDLMNNGYLDIHMPKGLMTLMMAIVSHVDKEGFAFPSIERLTEMTGLGRSTVLSYIKTFGNNSIKGRTLFYKKRISRGKGKYDINLYYVPACTVVFTDVEDLQTDEEKLLSLQRDMECIHAVD